MHAEPSSGFCYSGMADPYDVAKLSSVTIEKVETQDTWMSIQQEHKERNIISTASLHEPLVFDCWLKEARSPMMSSPSFLTSLNPFQETGEMNNFHGYSICITDELSLKLGNHTDEVKKPEKCSASYRLFGFDLLNQPNNIASTEKVATLPPSKIATPIEELPSENLLTLGEGPDQMLGLSKPSKEQNHAPQDTTKEEVYGRQSGSARSRTKVNT